MGPIYQFSEIEILGFILVFLRVSAFLFAWPIFGGGATPQPLKILLALVIAMCIFPVIKLRGYSLSGIDQQLIWLAGREVFVGLLIGFLTRLFFFAVSIAGNIIGVSMGLASAQLYNPTIGETGNAIEQLQVALATLIFLAINGHHYFLSGLAQSFEMVPLQVQGISFAQFQIMAGMGQEIIYMGLKISAPVLVAIFLTNVSMGIVGRAVPQINVLVTSIPITIAVGFLVLFVTTPLLFVELTGLMEVATNRLFEVMKSI